MNERTTSDRIVEEYLSDLREALHSVNFRSAKEFVAEIEQHISEGRMSLEVGDDVGLRNLLERIGTPAALARELRESEPPRTTGAMDRATPWLILFGGFAFGIGWLVGIYGLWSSKTWRLWDKLLGTLIWPGGLLGNFYVFLSPLGTTACSGFQGPGQTSPTMTCVHHGLPVLPRGLQFIAGFVIVAAPFFTSVRLGWVLSRGYADVTNPNGVRVLKSEHPTPTMVRVTWLVIGLAVAAFAIFVFAVH